MLKISLEFVSIAFLWYSLDVLIKKENLKMVLSRVNQCLVFYEYELWCFIFVEDKYFCTFLMMTSTQMIGYSHY